MTTAIIGLGNIGGRVAANLARGGEPLLLASREPQDAVDAAARLGNGTEAVTVDEAVERADVLVLAVWFDTIKELIAAWGDRLDGKIVVDPSNPVAVDDRGAFRKTLPEDQSSGAVVASLLPDGARLVKAFGTLSADTLGSAAHREPPRAAAFYATDDPAAGATVARLITASGYDPVPVGGIDRSIRIEVFGDLHESTLGTTLTAEEATARV
ncbi:NADPH-dependent F420 reductase [Streptomyces sp. NPDC003691]